MKQILQTPEIQAKLRAAFGADARLEDLAVYEVIALNTLPLRKKGGVYQGAIVDVAILHEMAAAVEAESIPLQSMHDTSELPLGRVFSGRVLNDQLHTLIAINKRHTDVISDMDAGIIDQVSVGLLSKAVTCSTCAFDYLGEGAGIMNWIEATCDQGHAIGKGGVFARITGGLDSFHELSLVGRGAARGARVAPANSAFSNENVQRLAAHGIPASAVLLRASTQVQPKETPMAIDAELLTRLQADATERATLTATNTTLQASVTALTGERDQARTDLTAAQTRVGELETQLTAAPKAEELTAAQTAVTELATKVLTATGDANAAETVKGKTVAELSTIITEKSAQLSAIIPTGGRSTQPGTEGNGAPTPGSNRAFTTPR